MAKTQEVMNARLWQLMQGLLYPAVLGALTLCVMQKIASEQPAEWLKGRDNLLGIAGVVYFCISYCNFFTIKPAEYRLALFVLDAIEICCIFAMFFALRLFAIDRAAPANMQSFYLAAAIVPSLQTLWRGFRTNSVKAAFNLIGLFSIAMTCFLAYMSIPAPVFSDYTAIAMIYISIGIYAVWLVGASVRE